MPKALWIAFYRAVRDPDALAAYAKLAIPALNAAGGRVIARGTPAHVFELGLKERTVVIEFDSVGAAYAAHESPDYKKALEALGTGAERDMRIIELN